MKKVERLFAAAILFAAAAGAAWAQIPSATGTGNPPESATQTNTRTASGGRFWADVDNYMDARGYGGVSFDKHFFFVGGRYAGDVLPLLGYATKLGQYYLAAYFRGMVIKGDNTTHNTPWDSNWKEDETGSSAFTLNDNLAILFGAPGVGGFRFDWIASDTGGTSGPTFTEFKGQAKSYNGNDVDNAEGTSAGSMGFILSYGNTFAGKYKVDVLAGFATPDTVDVTGAQVGAQLFTYQSSANSKIYTKLGFGYNLSDTSSVDTDYSLIVTPGQQWEQTLGGAVTKAAYEANSQHIINVNYSKTFVLDDKIILKAKPNVAFSILAERDVETESGADNGTRTTTNIIPTVALGLQYKPLQRLTLYTGTTFTLFDISFREVVKGADGTGQYGDAGTSSDITQGTLGKFDIGAALALTDAVSIDFNATQLLSALFKSAPSMNVYLVVKK
jgi:hypothetical protein